MSKKMSRRSFLKMTAAGAVGAAGMGVFAPLSAIAEEKQTAADESGIQWNLKADIVVLGTLCRFDGYETRNTQDIRLYLDADGDFCENLLRVQNQYKMKRSRGSAQRRCPRLLF